MVEVTVRSATCPAAIGQRNSTVASTSTTSAQPTAAAVDDRLARRARTRTSTPTRTRSTGTHGENSRWYSVPETLAIIGSNASRNVGWNAAPVTELVSAANETGRFISQLLIAVPIT